MSLGNYMRVLGNWKARCSQEDDADLYQRQLDLGEMPRSPSEMQRLAEERNEAPTMDELRKEGQGDLCPNWPDILPDLGKRGDLSAGEQIRRAAKEEKRRKRMEQDPLGR